MLALTMGDPAGIGGEIALKAWRALRHDGPHFVLLADATWLAGQPGADAVPIARVADPAEAGSRFAEALPVIDVPLARPARAGRPDRANAGAVLASIEAAVRLARSGAADGLVTAPISKAVLQDAGFAHPGHTEFLAALCGVPGAEVMMLAGPSLRVVPVTIHVSLRQALDSLSSAEILRVARTTHRALRRDFGLAAPRLAVAGLNPHAGESGHMGGEEGVLIVPAIEALRAEGMEIIGPLPPDTMFTPAARARYDAAICMYHDQALIPLKTLDMDRGVNITLGLPLVRTSPDHGTAFDIAGSGAADETSLVEALRMAARIAHGRRLLQETPT